MSTGFLRDYKYRSRQTDARSGELKAVDRELASAKEYAAGRRLYLTDYFMVSGDFGLEVLPKESIRRMERSADYVIAVTENERAHMAVGGKAAGLSEGEVIPDIENRRQ